MRRYIIKGFTLIEVMAAILILSGSIVSFIKYAADNLTMNVEIERRIKSVLLAEAEMEKIKNVLRKSFETDITPWPGSIGNNYLISRTTTNISSTLKIIGVSVGYDADENSSLGADEVMIKLTTQYAKRS